MTPTFLALAWLAASTVAQAAPAQAPPPGQAAEARPNVVLVVARGLGATDLGSYGSKFYRTPNLDRLAGEGRRFTRSYAASPVGPPTRASILTGVHPARLPMADGPDRPAAPGDPLDAPTPRPARPVVGLAQRLHAAGYTTAHVGAWEIGGPEDTPAHLGFDSAKLTEGPPTADQLAETVGQFLTANRARPFFLSVGLYEVGFPDVPPANPAAVSNYPPGDGKAHGRQENPRYAAVVEGLDQSVGRLLDRIEQLGLTGKTAVIVTSDCGGLATGPDLHETITSNAPLRDGQGWLYEGGLRVPLIVRWPGHVAPGVDPTPVWSPDLAPTVAALCGLESFAGDGANLAPHLLRGEAVAPRRFYWHVARRNAPGGRPGGAVLDGDAKLVEWYEGNRRELFDVTRDAGESTNRADKDAAKVRQLAAALAAWRKAVGVTVPDPNPSYVPNPQADDGTITLPARQARVEGLMLRFEPLPHKDTLGYWVRRDDHAWWEFTVTRPGRFSVEALIGCGNGSGGSEVAFRVGDQTLTLKVPVTGGFQAFKPQNLGEVTLPDVGRYRLDVVPLEKPGVAVMDLRRVTLKPVEK